MKLCKVVGKGDASVKDRGLEGKKLLVVQEIDGNMSPSGSLILAVDTQGAGVGEVVAIVTGSAAIRSIGMGDVPFDAAIVAIMEHIHINGRQVYNKNQEA
jgi:microcompartment protein CcmK/EutM